MYLSDSILGSPAELIKLSNKVDHHDHEHHQIVIALQGKAKLCIEGVENTIAPGQGCVVTGKSSHAFCGIGQSEILILNMTDNLDQNMNQQISGLLCENQFFNLDNQFEKLLTLLVLEMRECAGDIVVAESCRNTIITLLQRHVHRHLGDKINYRHRINISVIDNYIEHRISSKISVSQLAGCVHLGESQFHLLFKQQLGITPHQYILKQRLKFAKGLLKNSSLTLSSVASASGFANQSSFTHSFTRLQGISPSKYRH